MPSEATNNATRREWRELGFFYDRNDQAKIWELSGSRQGLLKFRDLLLACAANPRRSPKSEHDHYGPYMYLKIMTWPQAGMDDDSIHGTQPDFRRLAKLVDAALASTPIHGSAQIRDEFAPGVEYALVLNVREDGFDPASADPHL